MTVTPESGPPLIRVTIAAYGRTVTAETNDDAPVAAVVADALTQWSRGQKRLRPGTYGYGFTAERADAPSRGDDCPGTVRSC